MIRVAVVVRSRALRAALERAVSQRASVVVVPLPVGGAAAPMAQLDADVALIDLAEWSNADGPARPSPGKAVIVLAEAPIECGPLVPDPLLKRAATPCGR